MKSIICILPLLLWFGSSGQTCGTYEYEQHLGEQNPAFTRALNESRKEAYQAVRAVHKNEDDTVYRIPVVFHILWNEAAQNIHDSFIFSQMKTLNEAFRHTHKDTGKVRPQFQPYAADTRIEFYLAEFDPNGSPSTGINRVFTNMKDFGDSNSFFADRVKSASTLGVDAWNPDKYLNIWVCNFTFRGFQFVSAYAYPPINAQHWDTAYYRDENLQGIVINHRFVGSNNPKDLYPRSMREKTLCHEVGHYLGLRHIWADKNSCTGDDDGIYDTPFAATASNDCDFSKNSCYTGIDDEKDMIENYMDYTPFPCTYMFTEDQAALMRYNLLHLRPQLAQYEVKKPTPAPGSNEFSLFPNPATDHIMIQLPDSGSFELSIINLTGQQVIRTDLKGNENNRYRIDVSYLTTGIYIAVIRSEGVLYESVIIFLN